MTRYIVNLTNQLIHKNNYTFFWERCKNKQDFVNMVSIDLSVGDVDKMSPERLGIILCSLDIGDVLANRQELLENVHFNGDCEETLKELVSSCLAMVIRDRLNPEMSDCIIPYDGRTSLSEQEFRVAMSKLKKRDDAKGEEVRC
jgi:hypothetical protein